MGMIVAIGGGELSLGETRSIDREIIRLTGKENPNALFLPTASGDAAGYCDTFERVYGAEEGCWTRVLKLVDEAPDPVSIRESVEWADLIYVGGGDTGEMLRLWHLHGVDDLLREAYRRGTVLAGLSAGSICWFEQGHSDTERFAEDGDWVYIRLEALGLIPGFHCPHYDEDGRRPSYLKMVQESGLAGVALQNRCALILKDGSYRVLTASPEARAYWIEAEDGEARERELPVLPEFRPYPPGKRR
ncbi:Type 1 glutamine amidotransferase-like domain-containing protein [Gorillibacterium sp. sgz500922]|uniref:Type 1 glutamine amidotransferase-like domain-containing protein n=1 Tax=Gorillibacterium sp. sgz500922 TaxID=3446694 RepID=UPI003F67A638